MSVSPSNQKSSACSPALPSTLPIAERKDKRAGQKTLDM
jgi:hypothetical protein